MVMKTPGVYIVEKSAFPNSVVQVATAVPAFIGYTQTAMNGDLSLHQMPYRITSMAEYHNFFGGAPHPAFSIRPFKERTDPSPLTTEGVALAPELPRAVFTAKGAKGTETFELVQTNPAFAFYGAMRLFFQNGGGACYVTSIGTYDRDAFDVDEMSKALERLKKEPEPTMVVIPETTRLSRQDAVHTQVAMLKHCGFDMKNRFAILDISAGYLPQDGPRGKPVATFRNDIGINNLDFGAAYYPWLNTSVFQSRDFSFDNINFDSREKLITLLKRNVANDQKITPEIDRISTPELTGDFSISVPQGGAVVLTQADIAAKSIASSASDLTYSIIGTPADLPDQMAGTLVTTGTTKPLITKFTQKELESGKVSFIHDPKLGSSGRFDVTVTDKNGIASAARTIAVVSGTTVVKRPDPQSADDPLVATIDKTMRATVPLYADVMNTITTYVNSMPPAAAMAGLYTMVDNTRGVWKAPANVLINSVVSPMVQIDQAEQDDLNVSTTGKSINAIRSFTGQGTLVWGARTLDGNGLDWRYINVRRTMIMIEESVRLAMKAYVFEPNAVNTWVTIRAMIENFLTSIWKAGGLAGSTPADAFSVRCGLGETMTAVDILEGRLTLSVLVAVTRPAEFIEITVTQQMQKS